MMKHLTNEEKERIVQGALKSIRDKKTLRICRMYMEGFRDREIMRRQAISLQELEACKSMIREKLLEAGYRQKE